MTTVSPYAQVRLNDRVSAWGLVGFGTGNMTIVQAANDRGQPERVTRTDLGLHMGAVGGRGTLLQAGETGGMDLALKADAFYVETTSEAVSNEGDTTADASRLRLVLEGSRAFETGGGGVLTPGLELGLRHDGGDAETGTGVELGGRVSYAHPGSGLSLEASVRTLVAHEDSGYEEWGASGPRVLPPGPPDAGSRSASRPRGARRRAAQKGCGPRAMRGASAPTASSSRRAASKASSATAYRRSAAHSPGRRTWASGSPTAGRDYRFGWRLDAGNAERRRGRGEPRCDPHGICRGRGARARRDAARRAALVKARAGGGESSGRPSPATSRGALRSDHARSITARVKSRGQSGPCAGSQPTVHQRTR